MLRRRLHYDFGGMVTPRLAASPCRKTSCLWTRVIMTQTSRASQEISQGHPNGHKHIEALMSAGLFLFLSLFPMPSLRPCPRHHLTSPKLRWRFHARRMPGHLLQLERAALSFLNPCQRARVGGKATDGASPHRSHSHVVIVYTACTVTIERHLTLWTLSSTGGDGQLAPIVTAACRWSAMERLGVYPGT